MSDSERSDSPPASPTWEDHKEEGNNFFKSGRFGEAVEAYSKAIEKKSDEAALWSNRSAANLKFRKFREAASDAEKAIEIDPKFYKAYTRLHTAYCNQGRFTDATRAAEKCLSEVGSEATAAQLEDMKRSASQSRSAAEAMSNAENLMNDGKTSLAQQQLGLAARNFPDCHRIIIMKAQVDAPSNPDMANSALLRIQSQNSQDAEYLYARAVAMYFMGQNSLKNAQQLIRSVLEEDPDNARAQKLFKKIRNMESLRESGNTAYKAKNYNEAVKKYTDAIMVDPSNKRMLGILHGNRSAANLELKNHDAAMRDCDMAIDNGNDSAKMYARRSRILEGLEKWDDALRDMQNAAEKDEAYQSEIRGLQIRVKQAKRKDYYKILGCSRSADDSDVKRAYKKAALQWHPDKWAHSTDEEKDAAEVKFKEVGEAFSVLSDRRKRSMYDNGQLDNDVEGGGGGDPFGGGGGMSPDMMNMFNMMFAGGGGMGGGMGGMPGGMHGGMPGGMGGMGGMPGMGGGMPRGGGRRGRGGAPPGFSFSFE